MDTPHAQLIHMQPKRGTMGISLAIICAASVIGFFVPAYYDWTGADQSRPSLWIPIAMGAFFGLAILCSTFLAWTHLRGENHRVVALKRPWDGLCIAAIALAVSIALSFINQNQAAVILSFIAIAIVLGWDIYHAWLYPRLRWPMLALILGCWMPFLWVLIGKYSQVNTPEVFLFVAGAPMFLPAGYTGMLMGRNLNELVWLSNMYMALVLGGGAGLMHIGENRALAFTLFVIAVSFASSLGFHSMIRA